MIISNNYTEENHTNKKIIIFNKRTYKIILISLFLIFSYFLVIYHPVISDRFDFWHMKVAISTGKTGFIDFSYYNINFNIFTVIISKIANLSYDIIPTLPLLLFSLVFLFVILLRKLLNIAKYTSIIIFLLLIAFFIRFGNQGYIQWWTHSVGFILSLVIIYLAIIKMRLSSNQLAISLLIILSLISLIHISYKLAFFSLLFLIVLQIIEYIYLRRYFKIKKSYNKNLYIIIMGIIYAFSFNKIIYDSLLPKLLIYSESLTFGLYKIILPFLSISSDPLKEYYFRNLIDINYANLIWLIIIIIGILTFLINIIHKFIKKRDIIFAEKILFSLVISSFGILFVYTSLGLFDVSLLTFSGFLCFGVLFCLSTNNKKKIVLLLIISLISLNIYVTVRNVENNYYQGMKDDNYYNYLKNPIFWFINNNVNNTSRFRTRSDVFTGGYLAKEIAKSNLSNLFNEDVFTREDMIFLFDYKSIIDEIYENYYIINNKLRHFSARNWEIYDSWSKWINYNKNNPKLNLIYSTKDVEIYKSHFNV